MTKVLIKDNKIITFGTKVVTNDSSTELTELCFTAQAPNSTVELTIAGSPSIANTAYSFDGSTWTTFTPSTTAGTNTITLANIGDFVYFRNDITGNLDYDNYMKFVMSGLISASGNVNSMYAKTGYENVDTLAYEYCYSSMFDVCTSLTTAPQLPATTLASGCYLGMFSGCTSLQVSDTYTATAQHTWRIPSSGTFTNTYSQNYMFKNCLGTRSSNHMPGASGRSYTYYTQNAPI